MITTQQQVRILFWNNHREHRARYYRPNKPQSDYPPEVVLDWTQFVHDLHHDRKITQHLAETVTLGHERQKQRVKLLEIRPTYKEALEHMVSAWCPSDGSDFRHEAMNDAYAFALQAMGITHDSRMAVDAMAKTNPMANDMR